MFHIATVTPKRTLELPEMIAHHFQPSDRFIVWLKDDMVLLKRIETVSPLLAVEQAPDDDVMTLDEINAIVHKMRQHRRQPQS